MASPKRQRTEDDGEGNDFEDTNDHGREDSTPKMDLLGGSEGPSQIKNKIRRNQVYQVEKAKKKKEKKQRREMRKKEAELLGDKAPPKQIPRTLDNTREFDETIVSPDDQEVIEDEATDEFAQYFNGAPPKVLISTSDNPTHYHKDFVRELLSVFPNSKYFRRRKLTVQRILGAAKKQGFTDVIITEEDRQNKEINGLHLIHLPEGPTAYFKLSNIMLSKDIPDHGKPTSHPPELILNNFNTRLGHTIGRMFASMYPQQPEFFGRQAVTFHNQRDFIFFRRHRYIVDPHWKDPKTPNVRLQEIGPRFTLKLRSLQLGTFDAEHGEYIWVHKKELNTSRRRFFI
eukprot:TRINITY_DN13833_c0_g1_i1.p1 TRINITY_DN13833_c0_g1~~TRINITY_DN13833_c0_g1_i1.p1  ORF type:complete len:356 (-),score=86.61 TRINITY_DN13833_c0_g1_i1:95-1123(-)